MSNVLVTGATGFIGSRLTQRLVERGDAVTCLVRSSSKRDALARFGVRFACGDVRDASAMRAAVQGAEVVYHLAGLTSALRPADYIEVNAAAFRNVAAACALSPSPPTLVFVSSLAAAGPSPPGRPRVESDPASPVSHYGRAKRRAELIAEEFADRVPITIIRPPIVFGQGDAAMCNLFRLIFRLGVHFALGISTSRYSLVHVDDLIDAMVLTAHRGARLRAVAGNAARSSEGYYFVAVDEQPTFAELGSLIAQSLGRQSVRIWRGSVVGLLGSATAAEIFARLRGRPFIFNLDKAREALAGHWICSTDAIRRDLGFAPRLAFADRLRQTADWYRLHNWL